MQAIYSYDDYRSFIKARVDQEANAWGIWARLAKASGCQATYLSQAMKGKVQLTQEHVLGIARFFSLTEEETDFFLLLLDLSKAGNKSLKDFFQAKIRKIRKEQEDIAKHFNQPRIETGERETLYYSSWMWAALHVIITIPEYQSVSAIAKRLSLPTALVDYALKTLVEQGILRIDNKKWRLGAADLHIPKNSPMIGMHHMNWRQRAVNDSILPDNGSIHFTGIYSLSLADMQQLKEKLLELVAHSRNVATHSKEEDLICLNCDLFKV